MSYSVLADYYDRLMSGYPYDEVLSRTLSVTEGDGLDLGAGTGEMTLRLSRSGRRMTAVDLSNEALNVARDKSRAMGQRITFLQGDIADMSFGERRFGFVTAFCDVINYITDESSIETLFSSVHSALADGGTFVFDISAVEKLEAASAAVKKPLTRL